MSFLTLDHLQKSFGPTKVVHDFSLSVEQGEFVSFLGPSGCGKTTVLRMVAGFESPSAGRILIDGQDVTRARPNQRRIGMVFQAYALFPNLTVAENVGFGLKVAGVARAERASRVAEMLELIGLPDLGGRYPWQLSGGMQQRASIARALAFDAEILLMDEAFSALDPLIRTEMQVQLKAIQSQLGKTVVFITHDLDEALYLGDTIAILKDGQLRQVGSGNQILMTPADDYVSRFLRDVNRARVLSCGGLARLQCEGWSTQPGQTPRLMAPDGSAAPHDEIDADAPLEAAFATLAATATPVVVTSNGRAIGLLDRGAVLGALHRPAAQ